ncbi:hypothetical protein A3Q56_03202 [Intoshia linei]|uniref:EGF-like domain-containing protein n=1 Tax=Intoshia linei TaxID=1819745 RepID=A0A177B4A9_9BILA|nr:hypothetical protein A3Q56_03202 [Intoshia linei]
MKNNNSDNNIDLLMKDSLITNGEIYYNDTVIGKLKLQFDGANMQLNSTILMKNSLLLFVYDNIENYSKISYFIRLIPALIYNTLLNNKVKTLLGFVFFESDDYVKNSINGTIVIYRNNETIFNMTQSLYMKNDSFDLHVSFQGNLSAFSFNYESVDLNYVKTFNTSIIDEEKQYVSTLKAHKIFDKEKNEMFDVIINYVSNSNNNFTHVRHVGNKVLTRNLFETNKHTTHWNDEVFLSHQNLKDIKCENENFISCPRLYKKYKICKFELKGCVKQCRNGVASNSLGFCKDVIEMMNTPDIIHEDTLKYDVAIISCGNTISAIKLNDSNVKNMQYKLLYTLQGGLIQSLAVKCEKNKTMLYFSDSMRKKTHSVRLYPFPNELSNDEHSQIILDETIKDLHLVKDNLYGIDNKNTIFVYDTKNGIKYDIIQQSNSAKPRSIVVDDKLGYIFISDVNIKSPKIQRYSIHNKEMVSIISYGILQPIDLFIDTKLKRIYWIDWDTRRLESSDYYGNYIRTHVLNIVKPYSFIRYNEYFMWTSWILNKSLAFEMDNGIENANITTQFSRLSLGLNGRCYTIKLLPKSCKIP